MKHLLIHWVVDGPYRNPNEQEGGWINLCTIEDAIQQIAEVEIHYQTYEDAMFPVEHFKTSIDPIETPFFDPNDLMQTIEDDEDET